MLDKLVPRPHPARRMRLVLDAAFDNYVHEGETWTVYDCNEDLVALMKMRVFEMQRAVLFTLSAEYL